MNYKIEGAIRRTRKYFIWLAILWVFISIVLVMPITVGIHEAEVFKDPGKGIETAVSLITHLGQAMKKIQTEG